MKSFPRVPPKLSCVFVNNPVYFVTACTYRRQPFLATDPVHQALLRFARHAHSAHNIAVGRYVIMPEHVHFFVCGPDDFGLGRWMGLLKQCLGKEIVSDPHRVTSPTGRRLQKTAFWQRRFFDHVLRSDESYSQKWNYVHDNPVRAGLVANADDWPYAGEIVIIDRA